LLHKNLENRGFTVENYVLREVEPLKTLFNFPVRLLNKFFKLGTTYFYVRTPIHFFCTYIYSIWIGLLSTKQDVMLIQGFSYPLRNRKNRLIIIGDWPSEYLFEKFLKREPSWLERNSIDRENTVIEAADAVITLFPNVHEYMLQKYKNKKIYCFGNVVNVDDNVQVPADIRRRKLNSRNFLFVGQPFYLSGALELIAAARNLRQRGVDCYVDIVGIDPKLVAHEYDWLKVHGYLDKERSSDKLKYFELLANARLFVNTTPGWSGFQALLEGMYFHNPIVVRPNEALVSYFPNLTSVAYILEDGMTNLESLLYESINNDLGYQQISDAAKEAVESSSWNKFIGELIRLIK